MTDQSGRWLYHTCPICGSGLDDDLVGPPVENRDGAAVEFTFCRRCHTLFPAGADAGDGLYEETTRQADYHAQLWHDVNFEQLDLLAAGAMQLAWEFAEFLGGPSTGHTIVDIGAGRGNILHAVRRLGYNVRGCEPSQALTAIARSAYLLGPEVLDNADADHFLDALESADQPVSGFIIWHVLEHLREPMPLLRRCLRVGPDSQFFIELPLAITDDIFPEHLFFPTPRTLLWLAEALGLHVQLLQITEDQRLRVFYSRQPLLVEPQAVGEIEDLEEVYRTMSPAFDFFASGVASHAGTV